MYRRKGGGNMSDKTKKVISIISTILLVAFLATQILSGRAIGLLDLQVDTMVFCVIIIVYLCVQGAVNPSGVILKLGAKKESKEEGQE